MTRQGDAGASHGAHASIDEHRAYVRDRRKGVGILGRKTRIARALGLFVVATALGFAGTSHVAMQRQIETRDFENQALRQAYERLSETSQRERGSYESTIADLEAVAVNQRAAIERMREIHAVLKGELSLAEGRAAQLAEERESALDLAGSLGQGVQDAESWLRSAIGEKAATGARLATAEARIEALTAEREEARRNASSLRWRVDLLEAQLDRMREARDMQYAWFRGWVGGQVGAIEAALSQTGIEIEPLLSRAGEENGYGQGGPLEELGPDHGRLQRASLSFDVDNDLARMVALQRLVAAMPLGAPIDHGYVTSTFGGRRDPITRRQAFHAGLDLGAPAGTPILATAPGRVVAAGRRGPYGIMVEIDHGLGITTRYAHLRETLVEEGTTVGHRQDIGIIGATGRATGRHLHYEIRIDGEPFDPAQFLEAGRQLIQAFQS